MMKKIVLAAILMSGAIVLSGCNTVAGLGTDLKKGAEHVGSALERAGNSVAPSQNQAK
ncbi:MAG: hypothetical protein KHX35_05565 [Sutterella wadsworthensis]|nr:hypothetical protein [Sutterella wadsworthensis]